MLNVPSGKNQIIWVAMIALTVCVIAKFHTAISGSKLFRYHLGTVAFGSLLLALIQLMRVAVEYINDR